MLKKKSIYSIYVNLFMQNSWQEHWKTSFKLSTTQNVIFKQKTYLNIEQIKRNGLLVLRCVFVDGRKSVEFVWSVWSIFHALVKGHIFRPPRENKRGCKTNTNIKWYLIIWNFGVLWGPWGLTFQYSTLINEDIPLYSTVTC